MQFIGLGNIKESHGQKAALLKKVLDNGYNVAPFFVISQDFFDSLVELNGAKNQLDFLKTKLKGESSIEVLNQLSSLIKKFIVPEPIIKELNKHYLKLSNNPLVVRSVFDLVKKETFVAVRASDPNPYIDTYTNILGKDELIRAIKLCLASFYKPKAFSYSRTKSLGHNCLVVQKMVLTEKAGIMLSDSGVIKIKAHWGQTGFISKLNPDTYFVNNSQISSKKIGLQNYMYMLEKESFVKKSLPARAAESQVLEDREILNLAQTFKSLKNILGNIELEFGFSNGKIYIINVRPVNKMEEWDFIGGPPNEEEKIDEKIVDLEPNQEDTINMGEVVDINANPKIVDVMEEPKLNNIMEESENSKEKIEKIFLKYEIINPNLKNVLNLLKDDLLEEL